MGFTGAAKTQLKKKIEIIDQKALLSIQRLQRRSLNSFFLMLTYSGMGRVWFLLAVLLQFLNLVGFHFIENQTGLLRAMFSPLLAWVLGSIIKRLISRERPSIAIKGYDPIIRAPACGSFPSSHTAASFAFFIALLFLGHPLAVVVGIWALLVSISRLYLGVHYLTDVVGGMMLGGVSATIMMLVLQGNHLQ